jgi:hypothetical protein
MAYEVHWRKRACNEHIKVYRRWGLGQQMVKIVNERQIAKKRKITPIHIPFFLGNHE